MKTLDLECNVEVVERITYKVLKDTTGIIDVPTYEVWDKHTNRRKIIYHDGEEWSPLPPHLAKLYFRKVEEAEKADSPKKKTPKMQAYKRAGIHSIDETLPLLKDLPRHGDKEYIQMDGVNVKTTSQRYAVFQKSITCYKCGLTAGFFAVEKLENDPSDNYHFNLYGLKDGKEILFTRDHLVPLAKGGSKDLSNQLTMCQVCNGDKADKLIVLTYSHG